MIRYIQVSWSVNTYIYRHIIYQQWNHCKRASAFYLSLVLSSPPEPIPYNVALAAATAAQYAL